MACRSQCDFGTPIKRRLGNAHIVCGNDYRVEIFRSVASLPYTHQKSFASNQMQWFSWKTRRTPARWNDACRLIHGSQPERGEAKSKDPTRLISGKAGLKAWHRGLRPLRCSLDFAWKDG
jgi:hypothetical protein